MPAQISNVVQLREKIMFIMDHVSSPRFDANRYQRAINQAIITIVDDKYNNEKRNRPYSFQSIQKIRDQLYAIIKSYSSFTISGNDILLNSLPDDYKYLLALNVTIDGKEYNCVPTVYDKKNIIDDDPYEEPKIDGAFKRIYYLEENDKWNILFGNEGTLESATIIYLMHPQEVNFGTLHEVSDGNFTSDYTVIVNSLTAEYDGTIYNVGDTINVTSTNNIVSGSVYYGYTNHNLPKAIENDLVYKTASILSGTTENYLRNQYFENEDME